MKTSYKASIIKSIVWRILGVAILASITFFFTRQWITTTYITAIHHTTFLLVFYLHERLWIWLKHPKHWLKAITYEVILGMGIGGLIVYLFTGEFSKVTQITGTYTIVKVFTYYIYDYLWGIKKK